MRFRRALIITVALQSIGLVLSALFILLTARWLGPAAKGVQSLLVVGGQVTAVVLGFGFQGSIPAVVSSSPDRAHNATRMQLSLLGVAALVLGVAFALNREFHWIASIIGFEFDVGFLVVATMTQLFLASLALALLDFWTSNLSTAVAAGCMLLFAWLLALGGVLTPRAAVAAQTLGLIAGCLTVAARMWPRIAPRAQSGWRADVSHYRSASILGYLSSVFGLLMFRGDIFLVTKLAGGVKVAGLYAIASFAAELCLRVPQWAGAILTPSVAANAETGRLQTIKLLWLSMGLSIVAFACALLLKDAVMFVLTRVAGRDYAGAYPMLLALFPRIVFQSGWAILSNNLAGKGFTPFHPSATLAGLILVWGAEWLLIPSRGLQVAIVATAAGYLMAMIITFAGFLRHNELTLKQFFSMSADLIFARPKKAVRAS